MHFPCLMDNVMRYIPLSSCPDFEQYFYRFRRNWTKLTKEIDENWASLVTDARYVMNDRLTQNWMHSSVRQSMTQHEYCGPALQTFDKMANRGAVFTLPYFTYIHVAPDTRNAPDNVAYRGFEARLYHWLRECDHESQTYILKKWDWLSGRVRAYKAVTDKMYINRQWHFDIKKLHMHRCADWLRVLGRAPAERILRCLHTRLTKFYAEHKGKNKNNGSKSSRSAAMKFIESLTPLRKQFDAVCEEPLSVDSLRETA